MFFVEVMLDQHTHIFPARPDDPGQPPSGRHDDETGIRSQPMEPPRKRRRGGKIYSGCGTCRARKIKCDEARPRCCNCERSRRYQCDGYEGSGSDGAEYFLPMQNLSDWTMPVVVTEAEGPPWNPVQDIVDSSEDSFLPWETMGDSLGRLPVAYDSVITPRGGLENLDLWLDVQHNEHDEESQINRVVAIKSPIPISLPIADAVDMSASIKRLLHHYRTHVCQLMMPTSAPSKNPWLQLYLPMALQEPGTLPRKVLLYAILAVAAFNRAHLSAPEKERYQSQGREYREKVAAMITSVLDAEERPGKIFDEKASRQALLAAGLTLTTTEVFSGASKGGGYRYLQLCKRIIQATGGLSWWMSDPTCVCLLQIFRCLRILWSTSGWSEALELSLDQEDQELVGPDNALGTPASSDGSEPPLVDALVPVGDYTLDITFGISIKTLRCLNQIIEFERIKAKMDGLGSWTPSQAILLQDLEADVFDTLHDSDALDGEWDDSTQTQSQEGMSSYISQVIKENHLCAFKYSTAIFFRRALCDGAGEIAPRIERTSQNAPRQRLSGQQLVSKALEHLENIDTLSQDMAIANTLWPGFIAAVEAVDTELRHRALIWLARAKRHGIGNIAQARRLVMEVWRRVDRQSVAGKSREKLKAELSAVDWREVMRESDMYIMLS